MDKAHCQEHGPSSSLSPSGSRNKSNSSASGSNALSAKCNDLANHGSSLYEPLRKSADTLERGAKLIRMSAATCDFSEQQAHGNTCDFKLAFRRDNSLIGAI